MEGISDSCPELGWVLGAWDGYWVPGGGGCICSLDRGGWGEARTGAVAMCGKLGKPGVRGRHASAFTPLLFLFQKGLHAFQFDIPELKKFFLHFIRPLIFECMGKKRDLF